MPKSKVAWTDAPDPSIFYHKRPGTDLKTSFLRTVDEASGLDFHLDFSERDGRPIMKDIASARK